VALMRLVEYLLEHPFVYAAWQAPFVSEKFAPVERSLKDRDVRRILDLGCGPGTNATRFAAADYVGVDINEKYLAIARRKFGGTFVQADLETGDLSALGTFDTILVNSFLHHLSDASVTRVLQQAEARLAPGGQVHILELVLPEERSMAKLMARLDRGHYARPLAHWRQLFDAHFNVLTFEPYLVGRGLWSMVYFQGGTR
jgi:SAM-dependent methyltransferase